MRIKVIYNAQKQQLQIPVIIWTIRSRISSMIVIDTGSPHTLINYTDGLRLQIPHTSKSELIRIGGKVYQSYMHNKTELIFRSEDNREIRQLLPVRVLQANSMNSKELESLDRFPNLLGLDFLKKGFKLYCDLNGDEVYLEKTG